MLWERWGVVVEVDGIHHSWAQNVVSDALRHNDVALRGATVIRLPLLGLRVAPDDFFAQIARALTVAGWRGTSCEVVAGATGPQDVAGATPPSGPAAR